MPLLLILCMRDVLMNMQPEEIKASMEHGILTVTYPRQTPAQLPKKITIA